MLAEFARVESAGLLTVVGASFDRVQAPAVGGGQQVFVAMRVLLEEGEASADFDVQVMPPSEQFRLGFTGSAEPNEQTVVVDGRRAVLLALGVGVPLPEAGRYTVSITLDGTLVKVMAFVVEHVTGHGA